MNVPLASAAGRTDRGAGAVTVARDPSGPWRGRVTAMVVAVVGLVLLVGVVVGPTLLRSRLVGDVDDALRSRVVDLSGVDGRAVPEVLVGTGGTGDLAQVLQSPGTVVAHSANLEGMTPIPVDVPLPGQTSLISTELTVAGAPATYRVAALTLDSASGVAGRTVVVAGASLRPIEETVTIARTLLGAGVAVLLVLVAVATWIALDRTGATARVSPDPSDDDPDRHPAGPRLRNELRRSLVATDAELDRGLALPLTTDWVDLAHRQKSETRRLLDRLDGPDSA